MGRRCFMTRWICAVSAIVSLGLVSQAVTHAQAPLEATRESAGRGDAAAQYLLGLSYDYGLDVQEDDSRAVDWYRIAADQGYAAAQHHLGFMYASGQGVQQDFGQAVLWYRRAAEQGYSTARYHLGLMYSRGEGVPENDDEALEWFRQSAEQGDIPAQYMLGFIYSGRVRATGPSLKRTGGAAARGVPILGRRSPDYVEAHKWFNLAASNISITSAEQRFYAKARDDMAKKMTPVQLEEAQRRAKEWRAVFEKR